MQKEGFEPTCFRSCTWGFNHCTKKTLMCYVRKQFYLTPSSCGSTNYLEKVNKKLNKEFPNFKNR